MRSGSYACPTFDFVRAMSSTCHIPSGESIILDHEGCHNAIYFSLDSLGSNNRRRNPRMTSF